MAHSEAFLAESFLCPHSDGLLLTDLELGDVVSLLILEVSVNPLIDISDSNVDSLNTQVVPNILSKITSIMLTIRVIDNS